MNNGHYHDDSFSPELIGNKAHDDDGDDDLFTKDYEQVFLKMKHTYFFLQIGFHNQLVKFP